MSRSITLIKSEIAKSGGAEKVARALAQAFYDKGCDVRLITSGRVPDAPYTVESTLLKSMMSFQKVAEFSTFCSATLSRHPTDIIFGCDRSPYQTHLRLASGLHSTYLQKRIETEPKWKSLRHGFNPLHRLHLTLEQKALDHPDLEKVFVNSHMVKREVVRRFPHLENKITVIHNGAPVHQWENAAFSFDRDRPFTFLFAGHNYARKGLGTLLEQLHAIGDKPWRLIVVGKDKHEERFKKLAPQGRVEFMGPQPSLLPFYQKADALILPTLYDPFANVTIEALAMGLFVLTTPSNGGSEVITPTSGRTSPPEALPLLEALGYPKTEERVRAIRETVAHLDMPLVLDRYVEATLS